MLKKWYSCQKNGYHFLGGGSSIKAKSDKYHFFFFNPSLINTIVFDNCYGHNNAFKKGLKIKKKLKGLLKRGEGVSEGQG